MDCISREGRQNGRRGLTEWYRHQSRMRTQKIVDVGGRGNVLLPKLCTLKMRYGHNVDCRKQLGGRSFFRSKDLVFQHAA
ncbi:hypothetical protein IF2G_06233 [Cordyceps javanica]|nr:hypothetical protein IF2G_06233 [Cordyceps javanica]